MQAFFFYFFFGVGGGKNNNFCETFCFTFFFFLILSKLALGWFLFNGQVWWGCSRMSKGVQSNYWRVFMQTFVRFHNQMSECSARHISCHYSLSCLCADLCMEYFVNQFF